MTLQEAARLVGTIKAVFPRWSPEPETAAIYHELLEDLDGEMVMEAAKDCLKVARWEPSPGEIREAYELVRARRERERRENTPQLDEPEITEEQRQENLRLIAEYAKKIGVGGTRG